MTTYRSEKSNGSYRRWVLPRGLGTTIRVLRGLFWQDQRGSILLETVIASMVFSMVGVAVLSGLGTTYRTGAVVDVHSRAENVARNQMEYVFSQAYEEPGQTYGTYGSIPSDFSVATVADDVDPMDPDPDIERVSVTVTHDGQDIIVLSTLRFRE